MLWVDFVCINQADHAERSEQVQSMKIIFERATEVLGWVGLPDDDVKTKQGVTLMHGLVDYVKQKMHMGSISHQIATYKPHFPYKSAPETIAAWQGIKEIFWRTYWRRTWSKSFPI